MQYISTEGLLIDTIKNETKILGKTNTVEVSSGSFLGGNNTTKQNSISFGGRNIQTTDGSVSYGGSSSSSSTSSVMILGENSSITNNSIGIGAKNTILNAVSSVSIGGNNININKAVNSPQVGLGVINIGGLNNKIGSDSIVIGSSGVEIDNNSISIGGFGNKNNSYNNVVFLNTRNALAVSSNLLYVPRTMVLGDILINGNLSASGTLTYIQPSLIASQGYLTATNITNNRPVIYADQQYISNPNVCEFYFNQKPKLFVNQYGASVNTTNSSSTHALTISGSISASGGATFRDTLWFNNKTNGTIITNLYALSANILKTDAGFTMGGGLTSNYLSVIAVDSNTEGLRVTQTGSGPAFIVEDQENPDPTPFMILGDGKTGVGTRTPNQKLTVVGSISAALSGTLAEVGNIYSEGSVSIGHTAGTTTIPEKLTVYGSISATQNLKLREGTGATNGILFGTDCNLYRSSANTIRTDGNLTVGTLAAGTTNTVVTHNSNSLQQRTVNTRIWDTAATFLSGSPSISYIPKSTTLNTLGNSFLYETTNQTIASRTVVASGDNIGFVVKHSSYPQIILEDGISNPNGNKWGMYIDSTPSANKTFIIGPLSTAGGGNAAISITRASSATNVVNGVGIKTYSPEAALHVAGDFKVNTITTGTTDTVLTHSSGLFQQRTINNRVWNTDATFLSGSPTINKILKCTGPNTIGNTNMSDNGSVVSVDAGQFSVPIGTNALPGFIFNSGNNNGFSYNATNGIEANIGGSLKLRINTNYTHTNRLLVNTTSYTNEILRTGTGTHTLGGDTTIEGRLTALLKMTCADGLSVNSGQLTTPLGTAALPSYTFNGDTNTGIYSPAADTVGISVAGTERFRVNSSGQLMANCTVPSGNLRVNNTLSIASDYSTAANNCNTYMGELCANSSTFNTYVRFISYNQAYTDSSRERFFIGNYAKNTSGSPDHNRGGYLNFRPYDGDGSLDIYAPRKATGVGGTIRLYSGGYAVLSTNPNKSVIMNSPNIGAGTTAELGWRLYDSGRVDHSLNTPYYFRHTLCNSSDPTQTYIQFRNAAGVVCGSINSASLTTMAYSQSSDYRLKEDPTDIKNSIEKLMKLKPKNFKWKCSESRTDGFYAHEVSDICPDAVFGKYDGVDENNNPIYQQLDYSKLIPLLTSALQETIKELNDLKQKIK